MDCNQRICARASILLLHAFGCPFARLSGATKDRLIAAFFTGVLHLVMLALAGAYNRDRAVATGTHVLLSYGHDFDVALFGADVMHHYRLAHAAYHHHRIARLQRFGLRWRLDLL